MIVRLLRFLFELVFGRRGRRLPPASDTLEIDYAPSRDGQPDPGEVVWTWVGFEDDPSRGKDRPVLVVGRRRGRLVGVALTSKPGARFAIEVGRGAWDPEGRVSYAKIDRLLELGPIRREGAALDRARFDRVVRALPR